MKRLLAGLVTLAMVAAVAGYVLALPRPLPAAAFAGLSGDAERGGRLFHAGGCAGCHAAPGAEGEARLVLAGGREFATPFGRFLAPNISPDPAQGIGGWGLAEFGNALLRGVAPDGSHYYPAFPYTTYARMTLQDVADLKAYIDGLPASAVPSRPHVLGFPFSIRLGLGVWKRLYLDPSFVVEGPLSEAEARGRYLAEALAHCGECHTPRDALGGPDRGRWLAGGPNPSGEGRIPDITPARLRWSEGEIAAYLETGFTPEFDTAGGQMAEVVKSLALLPAGDRAAIAAYLKRVPSAP
ncbi:MAG: cytochrome c [Rhodobacteraceae bacterium]|jgi:mono/diheme cytochrome c family protein|nr:cytochrome c [Paracoccaceae bacterium]